MRSGPWKMVLVFDDFSIDAQKRELRRDGALRAIEPQVFDLLFYLIKNRDRVVTRDDVFTSVWNGRLVSDSALGSRINSARSAIGDNGIEQRLIRTIPRKGFRFIGDIREEDPAVSKSLGASSETSSARTFRPSLAVLPFANMSGDPEQEYFSDGVSEELIAALSRLRWFLVIARNSSFAYKHQAKDVREIGRELNVQYILDGSIRSSGRNVRITCQLLDASLGTCIWSQRYDGELIDIFALQDEIAGKAIAAIEPKLVVAEGMRAGQRSSSDLNAWDMVTKALAHFWKFTATENEKAIAILRYSVASYPEYAPAHSILASALLLSSYVGWTGPGHDRDLASALAMRAIYLDEADPWAHLALGVLAISLKKTNQAIQRFKDALELNPNFATAEGFVGFALALDGRSDEALEHFDKALRFSPRDPFNSLFYAGLSVAQYFKGDYMGASVSAQQ